MAATASLLSGHSRTGWYFRPRRIELVEHKWTLIYKGKEKVYILTEHKLVGDTWHQIASSEWATLEAAVNHIQRRGIE